MASSAPQVIGTKTGQIQIQIQSRLKFPHSLFAAPLTLTLTCTLTLTLTACPLRSDYSIKAIGALAPSYLTLFVFF